MFGLLPFLFALVIASTAKELGGGQALPLARMVPFIGLSLGVWLGICFTTSRWIGRTTQHRLLARWDVIAQTGALAWFALICYHFDWTGTAPGLGAALVPFAAMLVVHWWSLADAVRGVTGHRWSRPALVLHHLRLSALPLIAVLVLLTDAGDWLMRTPRMTALPDEARGVLMAIGIESMMLGTLLFMPPFLVRLWGAVPMPPGELRDALAATCAEMGIRVRSLMRWPVRGGRMYNAAVVGAVAQLRYVLFTDDLARDLSKQEVRAVLGHELGHVRHGHLWLFFLFANVAMVASFLVVGDVRALIELIPYALEVPAAMREGLAHVLVLACLFRLAFGWISRLCERQADLSGAALVGDERVMQDALKSVARLSGQPEDAPNWRHHSIAERVAFLDRVRAEPELAGIHHRQVARMRLSLIFLLVGLVTLAVFSMFIDRSQMTGVDPAKAMAAMQEADPDLKAAMVEAETGRIVPLVTWLQRADVRVRNDIAAVQMRSFSRPDGSADDRALYRQRHVLRALNNVSLGRADADLEVANTLAYGLVAGTAQPTRADLSEAKRLLPVLEDAMKAEPSHAVLDTIGCVHYSLGDYEAAKARFARARELLPREAGDAPSGYAPEVWKRQHDEQTALYDRRLQAAERALTAAAGDGVAEPLPLTWAEMPVPDAAPAETPLPLTTDEPLPPVEAVP